MKRLLLCLALAATAAAQVRTVTLPSRSALVTFRLVFRTGSAADPPGKPGLAALTAALLTGGGTRDLSYKQILDALFPMAASVQDQVDKQMTTFSGVTHIDNLEAYYRLFRAMLLDPGWRQEDFQRVRDDAVNYLRVSLRGNNDEELGKEVLYGTLYAGTPYGHENAGTISALQKLTLADLKDFYRRHYTQGNLILGLAGGYPPEFLERMKKDFAALPPGADSLRLPPPPPVPHTRALIVEKQTRSVAYSLGYPIDVKRGDPDYPALLVAQSYFGQHRESGGRLFQRMRELRGLNYGDYAYIEYFPRGMFLMEPSPNLARQQQIFQIWIRPVEPPTAVFALRLALYELHKLTTEGLSEESFTRTRDFLSKNVNLLTRTKRAELGYAIDSAYYGIPDFHSYLRTALAKLTRDDVNRAIRKHLRADRLVIVAVADHASALREQLLSGAPSPMHYNSPKPAEITAEDRIVEKWDLGLRPEDVRIIPVEQVFE